MPEIASAPARLTIPLEDLIRILQLNNPDLYEIAQGEQKKFMTSNINLVARALIGDEVFDTIDADAISRSRIGFFGSKNGCALAYMLITDEDGETPDRLIICGFDMANSLKGPEVEGKFVPSPYFCLDANFDIEGLLSINNFEVMVNDDGSISSSLSPDTHADVMGFVVYSNYLFVSMIQNKPVSLNDLAMLCEDDFIQKKIRHNL
jgi:hypothetical protein